MSFILDALRKSDQMRQNNAAPTLTTRQPATPSAQRRSLSNSALGGILLLGAGLGLVIGWWQPWTTTATPVATQAAGRTEPLPATPASPQPAPVATPRPAPARPSTPPPPGPSAPHPADIPLTVTAASAAPTATVAPAAAATPAAPAEPPLLALAGLPPNILAELPKLNVSAHGYSKKPKAGFVFINDRMLHEDDTLPPDLKLERITPDGMIFSYKGYRFRRGLQP